MIWKHSPGVMPALVAGIHVLPPPYPPPPAGEGREGAARKDVDGRDKPGHDAAQMVQYDRNRL